MPNTLGRNLHLCFTKIKRPLGHESSAALLSPVDHSRSILMKNYNSLYDYTCDSKPQSPSSSPSSTDEPDFATIFASQRFFFSSPGRSNSIIESTPSIATSTASSDATDPMNHTNNIDHQSLVHTSSTNLHLHDPHDHHQSLQSWNSSTVKDSVAVPTYSPDPYMDFRQSMQEMVEARDLVDVKANWDFLHELLLCYLALNPKSTHKFIVGAFADLLVSLLSSPAQENGGGKETDIAAGG